MSLFTIKCIRPMTYNYHSNYQYNFKVENLFKSEKCLTINTLLRVKQIILNILITNATELLSVQN